MRSDVRLVTLFNYRNKQFSSVRDVTYALRRQTGDCSAIGTHSSVQFSSVRNITYALGRQIGDYPTKGTYSSVRVTYALGRWTGVSTELQEHTVQFSSVQVEMLPLRSENPICIMHSTPSLRSFPNVAFETRYHVSTIAFPELCRGPTLRPN